MFNGPMMFKNNLYELKFGYRKEIKFWKKRKGYRVVGHFIFDIATGGDVMKFERHCSFWVICRWFKIFNQINDVNLEYINSCQPSDTEMLKLRETRIKKMHMKILRKRAKL